MWQRDNRRTSIMSLGHDIWELYDHTYIYKYLYIFSHPVGQLIFIMHRAIKITFHSSGGFSSNLNCNDENRIL